MGIKHLEDLQDFLKLNRDKEFSRTFLRDKLEHNWNTIIENLNFLVKEGKVEKIKYKDGVRFKWL